MSSVIYNQTNPLPSTGVEGVDLAVIDYDIEAAPVAAVSAVNVRHLVIGKNRAISGDQWGLYLVGPAITVTNEGTIHAQSNGISLFAPGALTVFNVGSIISWDVAILGGTSHDRIINTGTLETKYADASPAVMDLRDGDDFYDGILGTVIGGAIWLGSGNDTAYGGAGSEVFAGGVGDDHLNGGGGIDTVDYSEATGGLSVDLNKAGAQASGGGQGSDTLINIENLVGGAFNDAITGSAADNIINGAAGNDTLDGGTGNDQLAGGDGNDSLAGGSGNDTLEGAASDDTLDGGAGNDRLDGGTGINTVRYSGAAGAKVDLTRQDGQITVGYGVDTLIGITNVEGGSGADDFIGNAADNRLVGNGGNDTLTGGGGNDTLDGGTGQDTAVFSGASTDYTRTNNADGTITFADKQAGRDGTDTLKDMRLVRFSDKTIALTNGNPTDISLSITSVSEDKAVGSVLATPRGTDPDDDDLTFSLMSNPNGMFGINGSGGLVLLKALDYETATQHTISIKAEDQYGGTFTEAFTITVRNVVETTPLILSGTAKAEQVVGESGNDRLQGLGGNDALFGQIGHDTLIGGTGSDTLAGGAGRDIFVFDQRPNARSNLDYIQDFNPTDDIVHLSRKFFTKIAKGALSSKAFVTGNQFKDEDDRILYYKQGGALYYDPDGSGSAKAIQFANIGKGLKISHKDFFVI